MDTTSGSSFLSAAIINWVDVVIIILILAYAIEGYAIKFLSSLFDLITFSLSFVLGIVFYSFLANLILDLVKMPQGFANAIGFFALAVSFKIFLTILFKPLFSSYKAILHKENSSREEVLSKLSGLIISVTSGAIIASFILTVAISLPLSALVKQSISASAVGNIFLTSTQGLARNINSILGQGLSSNFSFLTIKQQEGESISLNFKPEKIAEDPASENKMLELVNHERKERSISELEFSYDLQKVARFHCEDMLRKGYLSHYSLSGYSPFDRMAQFNIYYSFAGENLAFAPNVNLAMKGLMQSKTHKDNILSEDFQKVGIGVIDAGAYGQIYCQEFTD